MAAVLKAAQEPDLLRFSTAGSVDDGKSTLIGRLLHDTHSLYDDHVAALTSRAAPGAAPDFPLVTDGLKAEREQGITIDVAYRYFSTARRRFIIADTPGHEQYTRNMATGCSTADLAVVLVDATLGVVTQTRRHAFIASLLGVPHVAVAVNKMDLVGYSREVFDRIHREFNEFAARLGFRDLRYIPMSALHGENVTVRSAKMPWYTGVPLLEHLESVEVVSDRNLVDLRFPVQRVVRDQAGFRGYSGMIASGVMRPGDEVMALPSGKRSRVRRIVTLGGESRYAFVPQSVTVELETDIDVGRGDVLAHPNNQPKVMRELEAMLVWMAEAPLQAGKVYLVRHGTAWTKAVVTALRYRVNPDTLHREQAPALALNEIGRATLQLFRPLCVDEYRRNRQTGSFIVVDPDGNGTAAAGMIIERAAQPAAAGTGSAHVSTNVTWQAGKVASAERRRVLGQQAGTLWLTGLSASGKSTIAFELERRVLAAGHACYVLDGDNIRHGLNRDLDFSPSARSENIRRVAEVARLFNDAGVIVITAFISPYRADRELARQLIGAERFAEVFVDAPLAVCEQRDPRGLYAKARAGAINDFTGVSAPYEAPEAPQLRLQTDKLDPDAAVGLLLEYVAGRCFERK